MAATEYVAPWPSFFGAAREPDCERDRASAADPRAPAPFAPPLVGLAPLAPAPFGPAPLDPGPPGPGALDPALPDPMPRLPIAT
jgi:hypothetical protein